MIDLTPTHFAQASLDGRAEGDIFTVAIPDDERSEAVARAFERLGCTVEPEPFEVRLRVTAPRKAA